MWREGGGGTLLRALAGGKGVFQGQLGGVGYGGIVLASSWLPPIHTGACCDARDGGGNGGGRSDGYTLQHR